MKELDGNEPVYGDLNVARKDSMMEWIFHRSSADLGCPAIFLGDGAGFAVRVGCVALLVLAAVWLARKRMHPELSRRLFMRIPLLGLASIVALMGLGAISGRVVQRIDLNGDALIFERCQGPVSKVQTIPLADMGRYQYVIRTSKVSPPAHEVIFEVKGEASDWVIPLNFLEGETNRTALERLLPAHIVSQYDVAL